MKKLYFRLAAVNIRNNRKFYIPYILMGMMMSLMFYTMNAITKNEGLKNIPGYPTLLSILNFGIFVIGLFVFIFMFYTNSFIMKRRTRELGIYNILGMEKRHIAGIMIIETFFVGGVSAFGGIILGILFNKFFMMLLYRLMDFSSDIRFGVCVSGAADTLILFAVCFGVILFYNLLKIRLTNPIELLNSKSAGEKEPKSKWILAVIGIVTLGFGYYLAICTESPVDALVFFFGAVILVIIGTYCLFTAGSIVFLKMLRKNKNYYYRPNHFAAVSGMIYRMKQNAVGLSNICILSTMVLVMVSTTVCMFAGLEDELENRYPSEINVTASYMENTDHEPLIAAIENILTTQGGNMEESKAYEEFMIQAEVTEGKIHTIVNDSQAAVYAEQLVVLLAVTKEDYETITGMQIPDFHEGVYLAGTPAYEGKSADLFGTEYQVAGFTGKGLGEIEAEAMILDGGYYLILPDQAAFEALFEAQKNALGEEAQPARLEIGINIAGDSTEKIRVDSALAENLTAKRNDGAFPEYQEIYMECRETNRSDFTSTNGGLFFLGILLGTMFLVVTVLIIFYKQISEGYEDRERYIIMEKVGMSASEVRRSINSQIRTVFLLPIFAAVLHVIMAFPMIRKLLWLLSLTNVRLFAFCMAGTILVFVLIYIAVFKITSQTYYKIVGSKEN